MSLRPSEIYLFRITFMFMLMTILVLATLPSQTFVIAKMSDKLNHFAAFYMCALLVDFSFPQTSFDLRKILFLVGYGLLLELIQLFLSYRSFSLLDLSADASGTLFYGLSLPLIKRLPILKRRWGVITH